jgi:hypothetical protein
VEPLYYKLMERNIKVFYDKECIRLGDSIPEEVQGALKNSRMIIFVLTKTFFTKQWTRAELTMGIKANISKQCEIVPYFVDVGPNDVPDRFSHVTTRLGCKNDYDDLDSVATLVQTH